MNNTIIQSLVRAIDILKCFEDMEELGVTEISNKTGLHKSTTFNIISTLERCWYLEKNESTGKYRLGIELFRMGTKVRSDLRKIALPYLEKLASQFKETVNFVVRDGNYVIYLEKIDSPHSMRISTVVGGRLPVNATAVGKAILSGLPDNELLAIINGLSVVKFTDNTIYDNAKLLEYVQKVRTSGYSEDFEELEIGLTCVAAPIFNHTGKAFAAISVSGPTSRMHKEFRKEIAKSLIETTQQISIKLGYKLPKQGDMLKE
jgi:IclR family KDG regulon transcriptional repressor